MGHSKQNKGGGKKNGEKYRKETKEERRARLKEQEEAREQCFKMLPYAGGAIVIFFLLFAIYVKSVPPKRNVAKDAEKLMADLMEKAGPNAKVTIEGDKIHIQGDPPEDLQETAATEEAPPEEEQAAPVEEEAATPEEEVVDEASGPVEPETIEL